MSKSTQIVWTGGKSSSDPHYHASKRECDNCPNDARKVELHKIEPTHEPCALCVESAASDSDPSKNLFECRECGNEKKLPNKSSTRCRYACYNCDAITTHDRL